MKYLKTTLLVTALLSLSTRSYVVHAENTVPDLTTLDTVSHVLSEERFVGDILKQQEDAKKQIEEEMMRQTTEYREKIEQERLAQERLATELAHREYGYDTLNNFLSDTGLHGSAKTFIDVATEYDIPVSILLGITIHESGWGESDLFVYDNNPGGIKCTSRASYCVGDFSGYNSLYEGLSDKAYLLKTYYFNEGLDTLSEIQGKYCPLSDVGCDVWVNNVSDLVHSIEALGL